MHAECITLSRVFFRFFFLFSGAAGFLQLISQTSAFPNGGNFRECVWGRACSSGRAQLHADVENYVKNFKNIHRHGVALKCLLFRVPFPLRRMFAGGLEELLSPGVSKGI